MFRFRVFASLILTLLPALLAAQVSILSHGAVADGKTLNTAAIQKTIDAVAASGGGQVVVPAGVFLTGTLFLRSNIDFHLSAGAVLRGSPDITDYKAFDAGTYGTHYYGILYTEDAVNVSLTGPGTIDGNEEAFFDWSAAKSIEWGGTRYTRQKENYRKVSSGIGDGPVQPKPARPRQMVIFARCKNVLIRDVSLNKSPFWTLHLADVDGAVVSGVKIWTSPLTPNSDGLDITSSSNVQVSDCDIRTGDDAIAITGYAYHFELPGYKNLRHVSENITITNCNLQSKSSGIRIGFLDQNTVRNVHISNVNITKSNRGIGLFVRDEGSLENITFSNMVIETALHTGDWWGNGEPIHISALRGTEKGPVGTLRNVTFQNIMARGESGLLLYGSPESELENIRFDHVQFTFAASRLNGVAGGNIDLRGCFDEKQALFARDVPALYIRHARGVTLSDVTLRWEGKTEAWQTHGIETEHVTGLTLRNVESPPAPGNKKAKAVYRGGR
jgi:polygalacturonase